MAASYGEHASDSDMGEPPMLERVDEAPSFRKLLAGLALVGLTSSLLLAACMTRTITSPLISETQAEVQLDSGLFTPVDYEAALNPTTSLSPHDGSADVSMEKDVAYTGATQFVWRNVLIPAECLARCRNDARCRVWVLDTQSYECSLKWVEPKERVQKVSKPGSVSGLPFQWNKPHTIFCYAVMRPGTYEQGLLSWQYQNKANIFACDEWAVYSSQKVQVVEGALESAVVDSDLKCEMGGEFGTALNTEIFFKVWDKVYEDKRYLFHEWIVKVDPDSAFFVDRLRVTVAYYHDIKGGIYFNNCKFGMHGPIEVFSQNAVEAWRKGRHHCVQHFNTLCSGPCLWGEDMFIDQCLMKVLEVKRVNDWNLISEAHCDSSDWPECRNGRICFHPFKDLVSYKRCMANATAKGWSAGGQIIA